MKKLYAFGRTAVIASAIFAVCALSPVSVSAIVWNDPASVVGQWSNASTYPKVIDINFSDTSWPNTWGNFGTSEKCPELTDGVYVNASLSTPVVTSPEVMYPINFHNCTFATKESYDGRSATTSAFARYCYYDGHGAPKYNDWKQPGHTHYLEDNIRYDDKGKIVYGEAGNVQMCRGAAIDGGFKHGWGEIEHLPFVERVPWVWWA